MKIKRIVSFFCAMVLCVALMAEPAFAYEVGEYVNFDAGNETPSIGGSSNQDTRTEEERIADITNQTINDHIEMIARDIIEEAIQIPCDPEDTSTYAKDEYSYVVEYSYYVPKPELVQIPIWARQYVEGTRGYENIEEYENGILGMPPSSYDPMNALGNEVVSNEHGPLSNKNQVSHLAYPEIISFAYYEDLEHFIQWLIDAGGHWIRTGITESGFTISEIPGIITGIIDFDTKVERYEALCSYLDAISTDDVKVQYIVEYTVEDAVENAIRTSIPQDWPGTNMTHFWEISCNSTPNIDFVIPPYQTFDDDRLTQSFAYAGNYHVQATQVMENNIWNTMSYTRCEYLIVEETGQVIWSEVSRGGRIDTSSNARPTDEQNIPNRINVNQVRTEYTYPVVYDRNVDITENRLIGGFIAPSIWDEEYTTVRIE